jgi:hypothetical protein
MTPNRSLLFAHQAAHEHIAGSLGDGFVLIARYELTSSLTNEWHETLLILVLMVCNSIHLLLSRFRSE